MIWIDIQVGAPVRWLSWFTILKTSSCGDIINQPFLVIFAGFSIMNQELWHTSTYGNSPISHIFSICFPCFPYISHVFHIFSIYFPYISHVSHVPRHCQVVSETDRAWFTLDVQVRVGMAWESTLKYET